MRNSSRRSSQGRVLTGKRSLALTNKRTSRKASRVAQQKISKNVEDLSNLGKKMRRPLNSADSSQEEGDDETEEDDADEQPSASKRMKSIGKYTWHYLHFSVFAKKRKNYSIFCEKSEKCEKVYH